MFRSNNLQISIDVNKKVIDFLNVTPDLRYDTYKPYRKSNNTITYIHKKSNNTSIRKNLSKSIKNRLTTNSKNEDIFNKARPIYLEALKRGRFDQPVQFNRRTKSEKSDKESSTKRKRRVTWFNPPFNNSVAIDKAKHFLALVDKKLSKTINRNMLK